MLMRKRLLALALALLLLCCAAAPACAAPAVDLAKRGSITVAMEYGGQAVPGGVLTLYRVAAVRQDEGSYGFALTGDFVGCGLALEEIQSADLARALADYAANQGLQGAAQPIDADGSACFGGLEPGLYLLVQSQAAAGYNAASPFLVSLPMLEQGEYVYDVQAGPKVELTPAPTPTPTPGIPFIPIIPVIPFWPTPTPVVTPEIPPAVATPTPDIILTGETPAPDTPPAAILPQTGQLNWPIPVLVVAGLGLFSLGWVLRYGKKKD